MKQRVVLYFGSFNPVHRGHIALAEYVVAEGIADRVVLIVSPQNPHKQQSGLAAEFSRYEMCQAACAASLYPEKIQVSAVEFTLPRPSYTIDTLNFLAENFGDKMEFSILMGADNIESFHRWKNHEQIIANYPILVYPRSGYAVDKYLDKITFLEDAPLHDYSSTDVRKAYAEGRDTSSMLSKGVAEYIEKNGLLKREGKATEVNSLLVQAKAAYGRNEWGKALNDFNAALALEPENREAQEYVKMIHEILDFRYKDIYNP